MAASVEKIVLAGTDEHDLTKLVEYEALGGYKALTKARGMSPADVTEELMTSELRGRGGAFFPTGRKWSFDDRVGLLGMDEPGKKAWRDGEPDRDDHEEPDRDVARAHGVGLQPDSTRSRGCQETATLFVPTIFGWQRFLTLPARRAYTRLRKRPT